MVYSTRRLVLCFTFCCFVLVFFLFVFFGVSLGFFCFLVVVVVVFFSVHLITSLGEERAKLSAFRTFVRFMLV